jgi:hypothetical protein
MRSVNDDLRNGSAVVMDADGSGRKMLPGTGRYRCSD